MTTPFSTTDPEVENMPSPNWFLCQLQLFWPRLLDAKRLQRIDSKYRSTILFYLGFFWIVGWTFWVIVTSLVPMFRRPLTMLGILAVMGLLVLGWLLFANLNSNRWAKIGLSGAVLILALLLLTFLFWSTQPFAQKGSEALIGLIVIVAAVLVVLSLVIVVGAFFAIYLLVGQGQTGVWAVATAISILGFFVLSLVILPPAIYAYPLLLWAAGAVLICVFGIAAFFVPIWHVQVKYGEVFLIEDKNAGPEKFRLVVRQAPDVDKGLIEAVIRAGAPSERVHKFLEYGGPRFMQEELGKTVAPEGQVALYQLFTQVRDPHRQPKAILQTNTFKEMRLVWNRGDKIKVEPLRIPNLITKEGTSLEVEIDFACSFDPFDIRDPSFWLGLADWASTEATKKFFQDVMGWRARQIAQQYFVGIPLQFAMTDDSIKKFRKELADNMAWAKDVFGLTLKPDDIQFRSIVPAEVRQEEINMLASLPHAQTETTRIQALVEQVFKYNVPPKLLAGLMMVDKGEEKIVQSTFDDMLDLPEPDSVQRELYHQRRRLNLPPSLLKAPSNPPLPPPLSELTEAIPDWPHSVAMDESPNRVEETPTPKPPDIIPPHEPIPSQPSMQPVLFSAFYPHLAQPNLPYGLYVYAHLPNLIKDISHDVAQFREKLGDAAPLPTTAKQAAQLKLNTPITITPECDTLTFDPISITKHWNGEWTRFNFDFTTSPEVNNKTLSIQISVSVGGVEIACVECPIKVEPDVKHQTHLKTTNPLAAAKLTRTTSNMYQRIFISYSHKDKKVAETYRLAQLAIGNDIFMDTYSIRVGENWRASLAKAIDEADVFQLFWSKNAAESQNVRDEWDYALKYRCPDSLCDSFIRPVYWKNPLLPPPHELEHLNFRYVPFG